MKRIGLIVNRGKPEAAGMVRQVASLARRLGLAWVADEPDARLAPGGEPAGAEIGRASCRERV